jgi:hypothetical protein
LLERTQKRKKDFILMTFYDLGTLCPLWQFDNSKRSFQIVLFTK